MGKLHSKHECSLLEARVKRAIEEGDIWKKKTDLDLANYDMGDTLSEISICLETKPTNSPLRVKLPPARANRKESRLGKGGTNKDRVGIEVLDSEDAQQEWSVTYYDLDGRGKVTRQDVATLLKALSGALSPALQLDGARTLTLRLSLARDSRANNLGDSVLNNSTARITTVKNSGKNSNKKDCDETIFNNSSNNNISISSNSSSCNKEVDGARGDVLNNKERAKLAGKCVEACHLSRLNNLTRVKRTNERRGRQGVKHSGQEHTDGNILQAATGHDPIDNQACSEERLLPHHHKRQQRRRKKGKSWLGTHHQSPLGAEEATANNGVSPGIEEDAADDADEDDNVESDNDTDHCCHAKSTKKSLDLKSNQPVGESRTRRNYYRHLAGVDNTRLKSDLDRDLCSSDPYRSRSHDHTGDNPPCQPNKKKAHRSVSAGNRSSHRTRDKDGCHRKKVFVSRCKLCDEYVARKSAGNPKLHYTRMSSLDSMWCNAQSSNESCSCDVQEWPPTSRGSKLKVEAKHSRPRSRHWEVKDVTADCHQNNGRRRKHAYIQYFGHEAEQGEELKCPPRQRKQVVQLHHHQDIDHKNEQCEQKDNQDDDAETIKPKESTPESSQCVANVVKHSRPMSMPSRVTWGPSRSNTHRHDAISQAVQCAAEWIAQDSLAPRGADANSAGEIEIQRHEHHHIHEHHHHHHYHHYHHYHREG